MASLNDMKKKLIEETGHDEEEIEKMLSSKKNEFTGVSEEGIVSLVARDLGVNLFAPFKKEIKIGNIVPNMRNITFIGKITDLSQIREFSRDGRAGRVRNITIEDETGKIRVSLWNDEIDKYNFKTGDVVKVDNCSTRMNTFGSAEARVSFGTITKTDASINVKEPKNALTDLNENDDVDVSATLLHIFERQMIFYFCPQCRSRLNNNICNTHGEVVPNKTLIVSGLIDDGSSTINAVFFNNVAEKLFDKQTDEIEKLLEEKPTADFIIESNILTKKFRLKGSVRRNALTNEIELRVRSSESA